MTVASGNETVRLSFEGETEQLAINLEPGHEMSTAEDMIGVEFCSFGFECCGNIDDTIVRKPFRNCGITLGCSLERCM